jgi:hypothetical protein
MTVKFTLRFEKGPHNNCIVEYCLLRQNIFYILECFIIQSPLSLVFQISIEFEGNLPFP